jgi:uncharacterized membrane protein YeaQ/YmgE (transglycosylase-associated protein family)
MLMMIVWVVIGAVAALAVSSFMAGQGRGGSSLVNLIAGAVGGFIGGYAGIFLWLMAMGAGPEIIFSILAAGVTGAVAAFVAGKLVK